MNIIYITFGGKGYEKENFKILPRNKGKIPMGLSAELLQDLWQIGLNFGEQEKFLFTVSFQNYDDLSQNLEINILCHFETNEFQSLIIRRNSSYVGADGKGFALIQLQGKIMVFWDKTLTVAEVASMIESIDICALEAGWIIDGQRTRKGQPYAEIAEAYALLN